MNGVESLGVWVCRFKVSRLVFVYLCIALNGSLKVSARNNAGLALLKVSWGVQNNTLSQGKMHL